MAIAADKVSTCASKQYQDLPEASLSRRGAVRQVLFSDVDPDVKEVEIEDAELQARWYSNGEYFFMKKEAMNTVRRMATTRIEESDTLTTRGLEIVDDAKVKRRKETINEAVRRVLDEQSKKGSNPDCLATIYNKVAHESVIVSIKTGAKDAKEAENILEDARRLWNPTCKPNSRDKKKAKSWKPRTPRLLKRLARNMSSHR